MATIKKRGSSYLIGVSLGYDADHKQIMRTMTWKPEPVMTAKQIEKELDRQAVRFEDAVKNGEVCGDGSMKLYDFTPQYLELKKDSLSPLTYAFYERVIDRHIKPTLGHMKLKVFDLPTYKGSYRSSQAKG